MRDATRFTKRNENSERHAKKVAALLLLSFFVLLSLPVEAFAPTHAGHEHDRDGFGDRCAVCVQLHTSGNTLKQLGATTVPSGFALVGLLAAAMLRVARVFTIPPTPITLKIRLNH